MRDIKFLAAVVVSILLAVAAEVNAVSVTSDNFEVALFNNKIEWIQQVQADGTGILNFTIHTVDHDGVPQPEEITASIYINGELVASEAMLYTDQGEQDIKFTWNNLVELNEGDWYEFRLIGSDEVDNHALKITRFNAYPQGDFWASIHPKEAFSGSADMIFDNHIIPVEEAVSITCEEVVETIEVEKIVEVIKYVDRPVEVIVYVDRQVEVIKEVIKYVEIPAEIVEIEVCNNDDKTNNGHHYGNDMEDNHIDKKGKK